MALQVTPLVRSLADIIAQTICECEGKDWLEILPYERDRYARIAILAEDRIRLALLDGVSGAEVGAKLIFGLYSTASTEVAFDSRTGGAEWGFSA